jgi:hypothetical protein
METYMVVASMLLRSGKTKGVRIYSTVRELFPLVGPSKACRIYSASAALKKFLHSDTEKSATMSASA